MVGIPRSKGCATCRRRKVKSKPKCDNCIRIKVECGGYDQFPVFINRTQQGRQRKTFLEEIKPSSSLATVGSLERPSAVPDKTSTTGTTSKSPLTRELAVVPSPVGCIDAQTEHALRWYKECASTRIADAQGSGFWRRVVPLLSQVEPGLFHLTVAFATFHEHWRRDMCIQGLPQPGSENAFALGHYKQGVALLSEKQQTSQLAPLSQSVAFLLMIATRLMQGHNFSAYEYISQAKKLVDSWQSSGEETLESDPLLQQDVLPLLQRYFMSIDTGIQSQVSGPTLVLPDEGFPDMCVAVGYGLMLLRPTTRPSIGIPSQSKSGGGDQISRYE